MRFLLTLQRTEWEFREVNLPMKLSHRKVEFEAKFINTTGFAEAKSYSRGLTSS